MQVLTFYFTFMPVITATRKDHSTSRDYFVLFQDLYENQKVYSNEELAVFANDEAQEEANKNNETYAVYKNTHHSIYDIFSPKRTNFIIAPQDVEMNKLKPNCSKALYFYIPTALSLLTTSAIAVALFCTSGIIAGVVFTALLALPTAKLIHSGINGLSDNAKEWKQFVEISREEVANIAPQI